MPQHLASSAAMPPMACDFYSLASFFYAVEERKILFYSASIIPPVFLFDFKCFGEFWSVDFNYIHLILNSKNKRDNRVVYFESLNGHKKKHIFVVL